MSFQPKGERRDGESPRLGVRRGLQCRFVADGLSGHAEPPEPQFPHLPKGAEETNLAERWEG